MADLVKASRGIWILSLTANVSVNTRKPALLQVFGRAVRSFMPESRREGYPLFVNCECLERIVQVYGIID